MIEIKICYYCNSLFTSQGSYCCKECLDKDLPFKESFVYLLFD